MRALSLLRGVFVTVLFCASVQIGVSSTSCAFKIFGDSIDWNDANKKCNDSGKQLARVSASNKHFFLEKGRFSKCVSKRSITQKYWIRNRYLHKKNQNCTIIFDGLCQKIGKQSCMYVQMDETGGSFDRGECEEPKNGFICEAQASYSPGDRRHLLNMSARNKMCLDELKANISRLSDPTKLEDYELPCNINLTEETTILLQNNVNSSSILRIATGTQDTEVKLERNSSIFFLKKIFNNKGRSIIAGLSNKNAHRLPEKSTQKIGGKRLITKLLTPVLTVKVYPKLSKVLEDNVTIVLHHLEDSNVSNIHHCVFLSKKTKSSVSWSSEGCTVKSKTTTKTTCSCNHLTTFAVLLQVSEVQEEHKLALDIIFYIGCALSLFGETVAILVYLALLKKPYTDRTRIQIRMNLLGSLAAAQITFLSGIESTDNQGACIFVSVLLHYLFLAAMDWMLMEGVMMYFKIVSVFNVWEKLVWFYVFAWGFPTLMVTLSIIIASSSADGMQGYLNSKFCWMSYSNNLVWTFAGPVVIIAVVNIIILILVVRELNKLENLGNENVNKIWQGVKACMTLTPLLGLTWVFGLLAVKDAELVFIYIFTVFNSFQGFLIFVFHVLMSKEVHTAYQLKKQQWLANKNQVQPQKPA